MITSQCDVFLLDSRHCTSTCACASLILHLQFTWHSYRWPWSVDPGSQIVLFEQIILFEFSIPIQYEMSRWHDKTMLACLACLLATIYIGNWHGLVDDPKSFRQPFMTCIELYVEDHVVKMRFHILTLWRLMVLNPTSTFEVVLMAHALQALDDPYKHSDILHFSTAILGLKSHAAPMSMTP